MIHLAQPEFDDEAKRAVLTVLELGRIAQGPVVRDFEEKFAAYIGVREAVAVSSGTAALMLALLAHGIGPGDEVITSPFSFVATANAILFTGAQPVFVDVRESDATLDPHLITAAITPRTRAILPVHLYGHPADMTAIEKLARRHGLLMIEDAAQAHGAMWQGRKVGSFGTGCFSLYATKNLTAGEGGIVTTNDPAIADRLRRLRNHGQEDRHRQVMLGYNFRLTELQAALAVTGLRHLDEGNARRRVHAAYLTQHLRGVQTPVEHSEAYHVYHQYTVRVKQGRDELAAYLRERGIETAIYYPLPIPHQPYYRELGYREAVPVAERLSREVLSLPVHPLLAQADLDKIVESVNTWAAERGE